MLVRRERIEGCLKCPINVDVEVFRRIDSPPLISSSDVFRFQVMKLLVRGSRVVKLMAQHRIEGDHV